MIPAFRHYLFDVDGTLLDSARDINISVRDVLSRRGRDRFSEEYLRGHIGRHLRGLFQDVFPEYTPEGIEELVQEYRSTYASRNHQATLVFNGVEEALSALPGLKATVTTKSTRSTRIALEHFNLIEYFKHVQGTDGFPCKPAPDVVLRCMEALAAQPEDCLLIGDTPVDMEAGRRAGVKTCAVRYGYGSARIPKGEPDYWVSNLRELANYQQHGSA